MTEESGERGEAAQRYLRQQTGISTLIRHLLRKCHLPQGEGIINQRLKRLPLGEAVERSATDEGQYLFIAIWIREQS